MDENREQEQQPSATEKPGKNAPEIKQPNEPKPEIESPEQAKEEVEEEDRFQSTDN